MATVRLDGVVKRYGETQVIHAIDLDIADGEFVVLVGPSGCGKSTLLRMIAGLETISGGELSIGGARANEVPPQKRNIAMVFQSYALYPHMTARQNIAYGPRLRGEAKPEIEAKVGKAAGILNLFDYLERLPRQLSGGQRQRVAMGRAIVRNPQVFLFDEPLSNLDAKLRVVMRSEIKAMHQRIGTTTIYVTHDQIEAMTMADKIVVLHDGNIEQVGAPLELYDRPANLFVAGFIGSPAMNFLEGRIEEGVFRTDKGLILPLPADLSPASAGGRPLVYGIRPEHIRASDQGIQGRATIVEGTGSEIFAKLDCGGEQLSCLFRERIDIRFGDTVGVSIDEKRVHLFDKATGQRL